MCGLGSHDDEFDDRNYGWYRRAPVELLLMEEDNNRSSLIYVQPSSLMVVETNPLLLAAARELDAKLAALASAIA